MDDAWCHIFEKLNAQDIARCRLVCKDWTRSITRSKKLNRFIPVEMVKIHCNKGIPVRYQVTDCYRHSRTYKTKCYLQFDKVMKFSPEELQIFASENVEPECEESIDGILLADSWWLRDVKKLIYVSDHLSTVFPTFLETFVSLDELILDSTNEDTKPRYHLTHLLKKLPPLSQISVNQYPERSWLVKVDNSTMDLVIKNSKIVPIKALHLNSINKQFSFAAIRRLLLNADFAVDAVMNLGTVDVYRKRLDRFLLKKVSKLLPNKPSKEDSPHTLYCQYYRRYFKFYFDEWDVDPVNGERTFAFKSCVDRHLPLYYAVTSY